MRVVFWISLVVLFFFTSISAANAVPFSRYEYRTAYDDFVNRIMGDLRKAGFELDIRTSKEITVGSGRGIFVDIRIKKYPESLKKYFGEPGPHSFLLQLTEFEKFLAFSVKTIKDGREADRLWFFKNIDKQDFYYFDFESLVREAKTELTLALYDLDCQSHYQGYTKKDEGENPFFRQVRNFSYNVDEFITLFFKKLKAHGFKYTIVERYPFIEMRIFGFPPEISLLLPEPLNAFFLLEANTSTDLKEILYIYRTDKLYREKRAIEIIVFDNSLSPLEKKAVESAKNVFSNLYISLCQEYYNGWP